MFTKVEKLQPELDWNSINKTIGEFKTIDHFWDYLSKMEDWYKVYYPLPLPYGSNQLLAKHIISFHNDFVSRPFNTTDYKRLHSWLNAIFTNEIDMEAYKQFCSNCKSPVTYTPRYPKYICHTCTDLLSDASGRKVSFFNPEMVGHGCQGYYTDATPPEVYPFNIAYIGKKEFYAQEARFGGIVVQIKD